MKLKNFTLILAIAIGACLWAGCATVSRTAYNTQSATQITAETAMTAWGNYVAQYQPGPEVELKVKNAYERYQSAMIVAVNASQAFARWEKVNGSNAPPEDIRRNLDEALAATSLALSELIAVIDGEGALKKGKITHEHAQTGAWLLLRRSE